MQCAVCGRALLEEATACVVCGAQAVPRSGAHPMALRGAPDPARDNNLAVAALVCGLLGLLPLWVGFALCLIAIGCGIAGIQRAATLPGQRGRGMAIAGLVLGLVFLFPASCGL